MTAISTELQDAAARLSSESCVRLPASRKVYADSKTPGLRAALREIEQGETAAVYSERSNPPVVVYNASGPYTDPDAESDR